MLEALAADQVGVSLEFAIVPPGSRPPVSTDLLRDVEFDGLVQALDAGEPVAHLATAETDLTVPGEIRVPTVALGCPVVAETHRGHGATTGMVTAVLEEAHQRGQILATLSSPYAWLHDRLGFGPASETCQVEIDPSVARSVHRPEEGEVIGHDPTDAALQDLVVDVYDRCGRTRTGTVERSAPSWDRRFARPSHRCDPTAWEVVVRQDSTGRADAYVMYATEPTDDGRLLGTIEDLWGETPGAERALWAHLIDRSEVSRWRAHRRPVSDPIRFAIEDPRGYRVMHQRDELWIRLVDIDVALGARSYASSTGAVTLKVTDPLIRANNGTYRVDSYGSFRSQGAPDLEMGVEALSAAYLGGTSFRDLVQAGRIHERTSGAAADADALFGQRPGPFCGSDI